MGRRGALSEQGFGSVWHLAVRFAGSLVPVGPSRSSEQWALSYLLPSESDLFRSMSAADRRHAIGVARRAVALLGDADDEQPERPFVAAALLHDVGKSRARLGTFGRVGATVAAFAIGREAVASWSTPSAGGARHVDDTMKSRMGCYLIHDRLGAEMLEEAGSSELTRAWAREHHMPPARWSVDPTLGRALKMADGD